MLQSRAWLQCEWSVGFNPMGRKTSLSIRQEKGTWRVVLMGSKDLSATVAARHRRLLCSSMVEQLSIK